MVFYTKFSDSIYNYMVADKKQLEMYNFMACDHEMWIGVMNISIIL